MGATVRQHLHLVAEEVERLEARVATLQAENERLTEALREVAKFYELNGTLSASLAMKCAGLAPEKEGASDEQSNSPPA
jgi:uncharacterized protein with PhoU and TrkA domain